MKYIKTIFSAIALSVLTPVGAQTIPADSGLAADTAYIALLEQEKILNRAADSIGTIIDEWRGKLSENPDKRDEYSIEILRMEGELFDIRNQIGIITTRTNLLEQEYLLKNTELSIKEIAYRLGGSSPFHFSNLFRERRGLSPSSFRERSLKNMQISSTPADVPETPHPPETC